MKKYKRNPSIIQPENKESFISEYTIHLDPHEPIHGKNRQLSMEDGLWIWVTREEHDRLHENEEGIKCNKELKKLMQECWMNHYHDEQTYDYKLNKFIERYGKNYL